MAGAAFELKGKTVFVAGHRGMVGGALMRRLAHEQVDFLTPSRSQLDLRDQSAVNAWFAAKRPQVVFLAAAKVGGIVANNTLRADFLVDNLAIASNVIQAAYANKCEKLMFFGSSCIYPRLAPQPLRENSLLTGPLEPTNEPYAIAKIAGIKMAEAYRIQYGADFISVMPTNLYGPGDNYHPEYSHVFAGLIRRFHEAKISGASNVVVWGYRRAAPRISLRRRSRRRLHPFDEDLFLPRTGQYRHRRGHQHCRVGTHGCRRRRLSR
ncbi:nucleoside-diphosphate-sugar epimerase [Bradyrhizobium sp. USDA 4474]